MRTDCPPCLARLLSDTVMKLYSQPDLRHLFRLISSARKRLFQRTKWEAQFMVCSPGSRRIHVALPTVTARLSSQKRFVWQPRMGRCRYVRQQVIKTDERGIAIEIWRGAAAFFLRRSGEKRPAYRSLISGVKISPERAGTQAVHSRGSMLEPRRSGDESSQLYSGDIFLHDFKEPFEDWEWVFEVAAGIWMWLDVRRLVVKGEEAERFGWT